MPDQELAADEVVVGQVFAQETLELVVGGLGDAEGVPGVARPVVALLDAHFPDAFKEFGIRRRGRVELGPLVADPDETGPSHIVPLLQLSVVDGGVVESRVGRVVAHRQSDRIGEVIALLGIEPGRERRAVRIGQRAGEKLDVVFGVVALPRLGLFDTDSHFAFLGLDRSIVFGLVQIGVGDRLRLVVFALGEELRPVEALIGVAVQGDEQRAAADHRALAAARGLQPLGQVKLLEQRTDWDPACSPRFGAGLDTSPVASESTPVRSAAPAGW